METHGPGRPAGNRPGCRDNGLSAEHYIVLADLDPRVADSLLLDLAEAGIAAYVAPTPARRGGYLDNHLPARHTDRLWVDARAERGARTLLESETRESERTEPPADAEQEAYDEEAAWRSIVETFSAPAADPPVPPWPVTEDLDGPPVAASSRVIRREPAEDFIAEPIDLDAEDHFVPPPPPPTPRLRATTVKALLAIAGGVLLIALPQFVSVSAPGAVRVGGVLLMLGGFGTLIYHMQDGLPDEDDPDDGAVV